MGQTPIRTATGVTPRSYAADVARCVRKALDDSGETLRSLADESGIPKSTLHRRLEGVSPFDVLELAAIARALDVPLFRFVGAPTVQHDHGQRSA